MPALVLIRAGGAVGAGSRYYLSKLALAALGPAFPWGTWLVNLSGSLLMGLLAGVVLRHGPGASASWLLFLGVGVLGGFTTFSGFSLEMLQMLERGGLGLAGAYAVASVVGSVLLLVAGLWRAKAVA